MRNAFRIKIKICSRSESKAKLQLFHHLTWPWPDIRLVNMIYKLDTVTISRILLRAARSQRVCQIGTGRPARSLCTMTLMRNSKQASLLCLIQLLPGYFEDAMMHKVLLTVMRRSLRGLLGQGTAVPTLNAFHTDMGTYFNTSTSHTGHILWCDTGPRACGHTPYMIGEQNIRITWDWHNQKSQQYGCSFQFLLASTIKEKVPADRLQLPLSPSHTPHAHHLAVDPAKGEEAATILIAECYNLSRRMKSPANL